MLRLAFTAPEGVAVVDVAGDWTVTGDTDAVRTWSLALATGAGWALEAPADLRAVPGPSSAGVDIAGDLTIAMIATLDVDAMSSGPATPINLIAHAPAVGRPMWQLGILILDTPARIARLVLRWRNAADTAWINLDGPSYIVPSGPHVILASRERFSTGYRAFWAVNAEAGGTSPPAVLDTTATVPGDVVIWSALEGWGGAAGVLEYVEVQARAAAPEELELVGRRFAEITPRVEIAIRAYCPRGVWSTDPDSIVDRELRVHAGILGAARAELETVGRYATPAKAFGETLELWEAVCNLPPRAGDGIVERRARLLTHLSLEGDALDEIAAALAEPLGDSAFAIEESTSVTFRDDFDATTTSGGYYTGGHDVAAWIKGGSGWTFARSGSPGIYTISRTLAATDVRYRGRTLQGDAHPPYLLHATGEGGLDTVWRTRLEALTVPADDIGAGLVIGDLERDDWTWIVVVKVGAEFRLKWLRYTGEDASVPVEDRHRAATAWGPIYNHLGAVFAPLSIRVRETATPGTWEIGAVNGTDPGDDWSAVTPVVIVGATPRPRWGGLAWVGLGSSVTGAASADWSFYDERSPRAPHALTWHAYRNPATPGAYDLAAAQLVLDGMAPAHTEATAIDRHRSMVYDDPTTLLDRDPIGT